MGITGFSTPTDKPLIANRVLAAIRGKFLRDFSKGRDMEELLLDYIKDSREFNFYPPVEYIEEEILELRSHKIEFFKKVLEEYRKDKERYDKSLEISVEARNSLNLGVKKIDAHKKKKIERQILQEEKDSLILLEDTYEINIGAFNLKDFEGELNYKEAKEILGMKRYYRNNVAWIPKIAIDCIHNFFILIKDEMEMVKYDFDTNNNNELTSTKVLIVLQKLRSNIQKGKDLEEIILDNIEQLKEFNLHSQITSLEDQLLKLRSYKIEFFKKVLEEYRKDKERYDKSLEISVEARKVNGTRYKFKKN